MEKFEMPHLDKAVGIPTNYPEDQKMFEESLVKKFKEIGGGKIENYEIDKTKRDIELINLAEKALDKYLEEYGRNKKIDIPLENIHVLEEDGVSKISKGKNLKGMHYTEFQDVLIDRSKMDFEFALVVFHELLHAKSFNAMQVKRYNPEDKKHFDTYRTGFSVISRDGKNVYFNAVNEAIAGLFTRRFFDEYIKNDDQFKGELDKLNSEGIPVNTSREKEVRDGLNYIHKIYEQNKDKYTEKEIIDMFINASINGELVGVARLIENTFGKGSFRKLGNDTKK